MAIGTPRPRVRHYRPFTSPLIRLYVGPLEGFMPPWLSEPPPDGALCGSKLFTAETLERVLDRFTACFSVADRRAVASMWTKWYFHLVLPPSLAANVLLERELPLALDTMHVVLDDHGRPMRLCLEHDGLPLGSLDPEHRFKGLLTHLASTIDVLARLSGAAPRVFWNNAGSGIDHYLEQLETHPATVAGRIAACRALLERRELEDGQRNPLFRPVRYVTQADGSRHKVQRLCCLRYLIPELGDCGAFCPLSCRRRKH